MEETEMVSAEEEVNCLLLLSMNFLDLLTYINGMRIKNILDPVWVSWHPLKSLMEQHLIYLI